MSEHPPRHLELPPLLVERAVAAALDEDLGHAGDITTDAIIPADAHGKAEIVARKAGVVAGLDLAEAAFRLLDPKVKFTRVVADGGKRSLPATSSPKCRGNTRALLTGERDGAQFPRPPERHCHADRAFVAAVEGTKARIAARARRRPVCRAFEKYAVRAGGGVNHRFGLYDACSSRTTISRWPAASPKPSR